MRKQTHTKNCSQTLEQVINAPIDLVWSIVRQFNKPQAYKYFIKSCSSSGGGLYRKINHVPGFPAMTSVERLDDLDDELHVMVFSLVGGEQSRRLVNYHGVISLHENCSNKNVTIVREMYTVDVAGNGDVEDVRVYVNTLVGLNLKSLARVAEHMITNS